MFRKKLTPELTHTVLVLNTIQMGLWRNRINFADIWGKDIDTETSEELKREALLALEMANRELLKGKKVSPELETSLAWSKKVLSEKYG